jgi:hypothetical protein
VAAAGTLLRSAWTDTKKQTLSCLQNWRLITKVTFYYPPRGPRQLQRGFEKFIGCHRIPIMPLEPGIYSESSNLWRLVDQSDPDLPNKLLPT